MILHMVESWICGIVSAEFRGLADSTHDNLKATTAMNQSRIFTLTLIFVLGTSIGWAADNDRRGSIEMLRRTPRGELPGTDRIAASKAITKVLEAQPGAVVELETDDGALVCEVKVVREDHSIVAVVVDAGNGSILEVEEDD